MADYYIDLVEEGIDLAVRIGDFSDRNLISESIGNTRLVTVGAISYFDKFPEPQIPEDLSEHNCIVYTRQSSGNQWHFRNTTVIVNGNLQVNDSAALRDAVTKGIGIGTSPIWAFCEGLEEKSLKIVLEEYEPLPLAIQVVYRRGRFLSAKLRSFIDFLKDELTSQPICPN